MIDREACHKVWQAMDDLCLLLVDLSKLLNVIDLFDDFVNPAGLCWPK